MTLFCAFGTARNCAITRLAAMLAGFVLFATPLYAAGLGEIRVRSALGERFDATVSVSAGEGESLSEACFQIVTPREEGEMRGLRQGRISFRKTAQGGEVHLRGAETENEPLLKVVLRLRCPEEDVRGITREYTVLLDPRESRVPQPVPVAVDSLAVLIPPKSKQEVPAVTKEAAAARLRDVTPPASAVTGSTKTFKKQQSKPERTKAVPLVATSANFTLKLSAPQLDTTTVNINLSEEDKLKLRERLLLIEADDQVAQLLQLKDRVARLEKHLAFMQAMAASSPVQAHPLRPASKLAQEESGIPFWLWIASAGLLLSIGFILWRRNARKQVEQDLFSFDTEINDPDTQILPEAYQPELAETVEEIHVRSTEHGRSEEWGRDDVDVVSPGNVAEEAQLLLDHGLIRQAIDLLRHEIGARPTALALWMKLFDAFLLAQDAKGFQAQALAFQTQFVSAALWEQVQAIGRELEPKNPLYIVREAKSPDELAVAIPEGHQPAGNDDFDIVHLIQSQGGESEEQTSGEIDLPLEFHLPSEPVLAARGEWPDAPFVQESEHLFGFHAPTLELPLPEVTQEEKPLAPEEFVSSDAVFQTISQMIFADQRDEACRQLEELLYKGSFEQRLTAAKWLGRLLPICGR